MVWSDSDTIGDSMDFQEPTADYLHCLVAMIAEIWTIGNSIAFQETITSQGDLTTQLSIEGLSGLLLTLATLTGGLSAYRDQPYGNISAGGTLSGC